MELSNVQIHGVVEVEVHVVQPCPGPFPGGFWRTPRRTLHNLSGSASPWHGLIYHLMNLQPSKPAGGGARGPAFPQ